MASTRRDLRRISRASLICSRRIRCCKRDIIRCCLGAKRGNEARGEFAPVGEDRGNGLADLAGAELQQPEARAAGKGLLQAPPQLRREFMRVARLLKNEAAVRRQFEREAKSWHDGNSLYGRLHGCQKQTLCLMER